MPQTVIDRSAAIALPAVSQPGPATSGWLSLSELRTELALRIGGRTDIDAARLTHWINEAYLDLCSTLDLGFMWESSETTLTPSQGIYLLPAHVRMVRTISIYDASTEESEFLEKIDVDEYRRLPVRDADAPRVWLPYASTDLIVLYPTPDLAYTITLEYKLRPARLTLDTHYPVLPEEWVEGILLLARAKAYSGLEEYPQAGQAQNEYIAFLRTRRNEAAEQDEGRIGRFFPARAQRHVLRSNRRLDY